MSTDEIDSLLERYLHLLDQYTTLRSQLSTLQSSVHQSIARANFSAERGLRYGQDHYDDRMQAIRRIEITPGLPPTFNITAAAPVPANDLPTTDHNPPAAQAASPPTPHQQARNPLRMFGILTPPALKAAQTAAVAMVEDVVPRLAAVDAEMREVEIAVRRARKHLARKEGRGAGAGAGGAERRGGGGGVTMKERHEVEKEKRGDGKKLTREGRATNNV